MSNDRVSNIASSHERRLQALERDRVETAAQMAEQTTMLKSIKEDLEKLIESLKENLPPAFLKLQEQIDTDSDRLDNLERGDQKKENKVEWYRKLIYAIVVGGGGGLASLLLQKLLN